MRDTDHGSRESDQGDRFFSGRLPASSRGGIETRHANASRSDGFRGDFAEGQGRRWKNYRIPCDVGGHFHSGMSCPVSILVHSLTVGSTGCVTGLNTAALEEVAWL